MDDLDDLGSAELRRLNALYLVSELELTIKRGGVGLTAEDTAGVMERLFSISRALRKAAL